MILTDDSLGRGWASAPPIRSPCYVITLGPMLPCERNYRCTFGRMVFLRMNNVSEFVQGGTPPRSIVSFFEGNRGGAGAARFDLSVGIETCIRRGRSAPLALSCCSSSTTTNRHYFHHLHTNISSQSNKKTRKPYTIYTPIHPDTLKNHNPASQRATSSSQCTASLLPPSLPPRRSRRPPPAPARRARPR